MDFLVKVKRKIAYRVIDIFGDLGFAIGTGAIALSKIKTVEEWTWWWLPVIIGYASWLICKLVIKLWRG